MTSRSWSRSSTCQPSAAVSHDKQPAESYRRSCNHASRPNLSTCLNLFVLVLMLILSGQPVAASDPDVLLLNHFQNHLEPLIYDRTSPPPIPHMHLRPRQLNGATTTDDAASTKSTLSSTSQSSASSTGLVTASPSSGTTLPKPFDTSLGNNFTSSTCPTFFNSFLHDKTFVECLPLSLLLQTSNGFFQASRSSVYLTQILDATCKVNFPTCSSLMSNLASQIHLDQNCGADLALRNPMVAQAYAGLMAYEPLYRAGCLTNTPSTTLNSTPRKLQTERTNSTVTPSYCFVDAITNMTAPTSSYVYYLPLGVSLPAGTRPSCNKCLQDTMDIFQSAAASSSTNSGTSGSSGQMASSVEQMLSNDYGNAASIINIGCGPDFVKQSLDRSSSGALPSTAVAGNLLPLLVLIWVSIFA